LSLKALVTAAGGWVIEHVDESISSDYRVN